MELRLEPISPGDRDAVVDLFNYYIENSFAAFPEQPVPCAFFDRLLQSTAGRPTVVAKEPNGRLLGFGLLRPYSPFATSAHVAEITYFVAPDCIRRRIGSRMLDRLLDRAKDQGISTILAPISSLNDNSIAFHRKHGFEEVGRFRGVCIKNGTPFDVVWMQKTL